MRFVPPRHPIVVLAGAGDETAPVKPGGRKKRRNREESEIKTNETSRFKAAGNTARSQLS